jgi:GTP cyclohydrolase I
MYTEMFKQEKLRTKEVSFPATYTEMIVLRNHHVFTMCPHHLMPVELVVTIGYVPRKTVLGLSKLGRVAQFPLTKPLKQEEYTDSVAWKLHQICDPLGVGVYVVGQHGCMRYRGLKTTGDVVTQRLRGQFLHNVAMRQEFTDIIRHGNGGH